MNDDCERHFTLSDLRDLFTLEENTLSDTHSKFKCSRCRLNRQIEQPPPGSDCTSDLSNWYHGWDKRGLADLVLKQIWDIAKVISFVFHHSSSQSELKKIKSSQEVEEAIIDEGCVDDIEKGEENVESDDKDDEDYKYN